MFVPSAASLYAALAFVGDVRDICDEPSVIVDAALAGAGTSGRLFVCSTPSVEWASGSDRQSQPLELDGSFPGEALAGSTMLGSDSL